MMPLERDAAHLWDMLEAAEQAVELSSDVDHDQLLNDVRTRYAVERALEIVGAAARRVSQGTKDAHPKIPWAGIVGLRNVLAHEYGEIDYRRLHTVLKDDVPDLVAELKRLLDSI
jgi:uncharacterized protein with HEPN domain